jgi:hypothetical protein
MVSSGTVEFLDEAPALLWAHLLQAIAQSERHRLAARLAFMAA